MGGFANNAPIVTDGLVFYVDAGNSNSYPGSGTTWYDLSGRKNDGTFSATPTTSNLGGGSITFDGIDDKCEFPAASFVAGDAATISLWYYGRTPHRASMTFYIGKGSSRYYSCHIPWSNGTIYFDHMGHQGSSRLSQYGGNTSIGWHNWVFLTDSSSPQKQHIYKDGSLWASDADAVSISGDHDTVIIGSYGTVNYDNGTYSSVSFYNRALSASEITQNYNALKGRFI